VQRADILGGRTFAMRIWLKPDRLAAFNISPAQVSAALAANNHLSALGNTKGSLVQVALTANTDLRSVDEFKNLVIRQQNNAIVRIATSPTSSWAPRTTTPTSSSRARPRCSWASSSCRTPTRST
jgi:multidrug efflux pump subunit AcrB